MPLDINILMNWGFLPPKNCEQIILLFQLNAIGGAAVMKSLVQDISVEYATLLVTTVIGAYTFIGGLGATFYVSYFNTGIIYILMMVFVMNVFNDDSSTRTLGNAFRNHPRREHFIS